MNMMVSDLVAFEELINLDKPSLKGLIYMLRHPEEWPEGFTWYYNSCSQCAMGLAHTLWRDRVPFPLMANADYVGRIFGLSHHQVNRAFLGNAFRTKCDPQSNIEHIEFGKVTPDMVADELEKYL